MEFYLRRRFYAALFTLAHLALCPAAILFLLAAEIVRVGFVPGLGFVAGLPVLCFAHRAFCVNGRCRM